MAQKWGWLIGKGAYKDHTHVTICFKGFMRRGKGPNLTRRKFGAIAHRQKKKEWLPHPLAVSYGAEGGAPEETTTNGE